jgi:hypothetical protein
VRARARDRHTGRCHSTCKFRLASRWAAGGTGVFALGTATLAGTTTGGVLGATGTALAAGAIGGAVGSIISQGAAIALDLQDSFDWRGVALGALSGAVGAGFARAGSLVSLTSESGLGRQLFAASVNSTAANATTQGIAVLTKLQDKFDWRALAQTAVAAPLAQYVGGKVANRFGGAEALAADRYNVTKFARDAAGSITTAAVRSGLGGRFDVRQVVSDVFGNALANSIVDRAQRPRPFSEQQRREQYDSSASTSQSRRNTNLEQLQFIPLDLNPESAGMLQSNAEELLASLAPPNLEFETDPRVADASPAARAAARETTVGSVPDAAATVNTYTDPRLLAGELFPAFKPILGAPEFISGFGDGFQRGIDRLGDTVRGVPADIGSWLADEALTIRDNSFSETDTAAFFRGTAGTAGELVDKGLGQSLRDGYDFAVGSTTDLFEAGSAAFDRWYANTNFLEKSYDLGGVAGEGAFDAALGAGSTRAAAFLRGIELELTVIDVPSRGRQSGALGLRLTRKQLTLPEPLDINIRFGQGNAIQGADWEDYLDSLGTLGLRTPPKFETFDFYNAKTRAATSAKTLDTSTSFSRANPGSAYYAAKSYIDEAADFVRPRARSPFRLDSSIISQREVRLAVPISTTPAQWSELGRAVVYAKQRGVSLVVDQIGRRR